MDRLEALRQQVERKTEELLRAANQALKEYVSEAIPSSASRATSRTVGCENRRTFESEERAALT